MSRKNPDAVKFTEANLIPQTFKGQSYIDLFRGYRV